MSSYFSMKTNKRKVKKRLQRMTKFSRRFDVVNGKFFSIFLGVFAGIFKVTHLAQVINFCEMAQGSIDQPKVDKNNRESTFFFVFVFFQHSSKTSFYCPFINTTAKTKSLLSFLLRNLCFSNGLFTHALAKGADRITIAKQISK